MSALAAVVIVAVAGLLVLAVWLDRVPVRRIALLRLAFAPLAVATVVLPGGAGLLAFVIVLAALAAVTVLTYRRHGMAAWPHRRMSVPLDPQLHRNGVRRVRPRDARADAVAPHEHELVERLAVHGIVRAFVIGFDGSGPLIVHLGTDTDARLEQLGAADPLLPEVRQILASCGVAPDVVAQVRTMAISAETVEREFAGNWFAATR
jgi:hypothetical protein